MSHHVHLSHCGDPSTCADSWRTCLSNVSRCHWSTCIRKALELTPYDPCKRDLGVICKPAFCPVCAISLPRSALGGHLSIVHAWRNPARAYAHGSNCRACMKEFHTRPNLLKHLCYSSPPCLDIVMAHYMPLEPGVIVALDREDLKLKKKLRKQGRKDTFTGVPCFRYPGPLLDLP